MWAFGQRLQGRLSLELAGPGLSCRLVTALVIVFIVKDTTFADGGLLLQSERPETTEPKASQTQELPTP